MNYELLYVSGISYKKEVEKHVDIGPNILAKYPLAKLPCYSCIGYDIEYRDVTMM